jgi:hypothetical protein
MKTGVEPTFDVCLWNMFETMDQSPNNGIRLSWRNVVII